MTNIVRKDGLAVKMAKKDMRVSVESKVELLLSENPEDAYTINGILIEAFGVDAKDLHGPWSQWPGKLPTLYGRVRRTLDRLVVAGKVTKAKNGPASFWAWKEM
jgi:hypothetical protein